MPVFNAERYLAQAMDSVLGQTLADFELIAIDDGSTDSSRQILERYAASDARVRLFSRPNTGYAVALNEVLGHARGEFLARMDADDVCVPHRFARQVQFLHEHPDVVAVGAWTLLIDCDGDPIGYCKVPQAHDEIDRGNLAGGGSMMPHPAVMFRRAALVQMGGYRTEFEPAEDYDLFLRMAERGRLANVGEVLLHYRAHLKSVSHVRAERQRASSLRALAEARHRRGLVNPAVGASCIDAVRSEIDVIRGWTRTAFWTGHYRTARKYAWRGLRCAPGSPESWWLLLRATMGRTGGGLKRAIRWGLRRSEAQKPSRVLLHPTNV